MIQAAAPLSLTPKRYYTWISAHTSASQLSLELDELRAKVWRRAEHYNTQLTHFSLDTLQDTPDMEVMHVKSRVGTRPYVSPLCDPNSTCLRMHSTQELNLPSLVYRQLILLESPSLSSPVYELPLANFYLVAWVAPPHTPLPIVYSCIRILIHGFSG